MPQELDPSQFEAVGVSPGAEAIGGALEPIDAEPLPSYANGMSELTPVNKSPVSILDRAKLSMGNTAGKITFLKSQFEDAKYNKNKDLVVKDRGVWHRVDEQTLGDGDAWDVSRKIVNMLTPLPLRAAGKMAGLDMSTPDVKAAAGEVADMSGGALPMAGGIGGAALGSGVASVPLAGAGAGLGEGLRTSLGRLVGTYEATPEEQAMDIGKEVLLGAGGQTIAIGAKPTLEMLSAAMKPFTQGATNYAKEVFSSLWGNATGAGRWAVRRMMDASDYVMPKVQTALKAIGPGVSPTEAIGFAKDQQIKIVRAIAERSKSALQNQYKGDMREFLGSVSDDFAADAGGMIRAVQQKMADAGYGQFVSARSGSKAIAPISGAIEEKAAGPQVFKLFTPEQMAQQMGTEVGQLPKLMGSNTRASMEELVRLTNEYSKAGVLKGKAGASKLVDFKKAVGETFDDLLAGTEVPDAVRRSVMGVKQDLEDQVGQAFINHSEDTFNAFSKMNQRYAESADAVKLFNSAVRQGTEENLVPQLVAKSGSNRTLKEEAHAAAKLLGAEGNTMMQSLLDWEAAKGFVDFVPKAGGSSLDMATKYAGMITQQSNPRAVGAQIAYGNKAIDFLKSLGPNGTRDLLKNDKAVQAFAHTLLEGYTQEEPAIEQTLREAGVK